jgi:hypothetical protein
MKLVAIWLIATVTFAAFWNTNRSGKPDEVSPPALVRFAAMHEGRDFFHSHTLTRLVME